MRTKVLLLLILSTVILLFACSKKEDNLSDVLANKEVTNNSEEDEDKNNIEKYEETQAENPTEVDSEEEISKVDEEEKSIGEKPIEDKPQEDKSIEESPEANEEKPQEEEPKEEEPPLANEEKAQEDKPIEEEPPFANEEKPQEDKPIKEEPPLANEEKPQEDKPIEEEPPLANEEKAQEDKPIKEEPPVANEEKLQEDKPIEEEPPLANEEKVQEEEPQEEESPVAEEEKPKKEEPKKEEPKKDTVKKTVVIDGYNLTDSVNGTSLKDAYNDYFKIGVGLNGYNIQTDTLQSAAMSEIIKYHFNSATYSNLMKPSYLLDQNASIRNYENGIDQPVVNFSSCIKGLEFCKENNIQMRGHTLVWHNQVPEWFFREGYKSDGAFVDRDTMLVRLESFIMQVLTFTQVRYPGVIYCWDVVNEAVEIAPGSYENKSGFNIRTKYGNNQENLWHKIVGVDYVEKSFEYARKYADKDVKLFYNDYNTFQPDKTAKIYELASYLKSKDLIDGIGMQGYMSLGYPGIESGGHNIKTAITKFAELDLEIHITELSISSDNNKRDSMEKQAKRYETLFKLLVDMDTASGKSANITSVTVFGLMDEYMFYSDDTNYSRLFDKKLQPKTSFYSILSVVE